MISVREQEKLRATAIRMQRARLENEKPQMGHITANRTLIWIERIFDGSKLFIVPIALLAAIASSVRTIQTAAEIYTASGTHPIGVVIVGFAFFISVEGALFVLALALEAENIRHSHTKQIVTLRTIWQGILVRLGLREPLPVPASQRGNLKLVIAIALTFAIAANAYIGIRPLTAALGDVSLQQFFNSLWHAPAQLQITFIVDFAGIIFPPLMALAAGHLTAGYAAEASQRLEIFREEYRMALKNWQQRYEQPLETPEGQALLASLIAEKQKARPEQGDPDFLAQNGHKGS
jgi:hypothetical protein